MTQLGGHGVYLDWRTTNFMLGDVRDETKYLSRNVDCIMARLLRNADLTAMAEASRVPVINGCDEKYHPCQIIVDLVTIKEKIGKLKGLKLVYIGVHNNVCNSLIEGCTKTGIKISEGINWVNDKWNKVRVERDILKKTITVYINDMSNPVMVAKDRTLIMGYLGFGSIDTPGKIDNIKIWAPTFIPGETNIFDTIPVPDN